MTKADIKKRVKLAKSFIDKLDDVAGDEEVLAEILNNLVDVLKPIGGKSANYQKLCDTVEGIIGSGFASKTAINDKQLEKRKRSLKAVVEFFNCFKVDINYMDESDYNPEKLITGDEKKD
jgi:hypothetical protein